MCIMTPLTRLMKIILCDLIWVLTFNGCIGDYAFVGETLWLDLSATFDYLYWIHNDTTVARCVKGEAPCCFLPNCRMFQNGTLFLTDVSTNASGVYVAIFAATGGTGKNISEVYHVDVLYRGETNCSACGNRSGYAHIRPFESSDADSERKELNSLASFSDLFGPFGFFILTYTISICCFVAACCSCVGVLYVIWREQTHATYNISSHLSAAETAMSELTVLRVDVPPPYEP